MGKPKDFKGGGFAGVIEAIEGRQKVKGKSGEWSGE
jgi:hypothetical protein